jgi:hypothetical protein
MIMRRGRTRAAGRARPGRLPGDGTRVYSKVKVPTLQTSTFSCFT